MDKVRAFVNENLEKIEGWCSLEKAHALINIVETNNITRFVELGVHGGRSLAPVALAIQALAKPDTFIVGVDAWSSVASLEGPSQAQEHRDWWGNVDYNLMQHLAQKTMEIFGVDKIVTLKKISSLDFASEIADQSLDMLHQDGNHSLEVSTREVELYWNKVRMNGWWIFDDTNWESTQNAQRLLESRGYVCMQDHGGWKAYQRLN